MSLTITSTNNVAGCYIVEEFSAKEMRRIYENNCKIEDDIDRQRNYLVAIIEEAARKGKYFIKYNSSLRDENTKFFLSRGFSIESAFTPGIEVKQYLIISW